LDLATQIATLLLFIINRHKEHKYKTVNPKVVYGVSARMIALTPFSHYNSIITNSM